MDRSLRTEGCADKYAIAYATDHMLHRSYDGYFDPFYILHELAKASPQTCDIPSLTVGMISLRARTSSSWISWKIVGTMRINFERITSE